MKLGFSRKNDIILLKKIQPFFDKQISSVYRFPLGGLSSANEAVGSKNSGVCRLEIHFSDGEKQELALKSKSQRTLVNGIMLLSKKSPKLRMDLLLNHKIFSYNDSHRREIGIYKKIDESLTKNMACYKGSFITFPRTYNLLFSFYNESTEKLSLNLAKKILDEILEFHIFYYNDDNSARKLGLNIYTPNDYKNAKKCIYGLYNSRHKENIKLYGEKKDREISDFIDNIDKIIAKYSWHRSFTHNDFSTRNMFFDKGRFLFYDFELSCYQNPEHDLVEFLMYDLGSFTDKEVKELIEYYKRGLRQGGVEILDEDYYKLLVYNAFEFVVNRLSMTKTINERAELDFAKLSVPNSIRLLKILETIK